MNKLDKLSRDIENLRQEMHQTIISEKDILSCKVLTKSQRLDKLIVEHDTITSKINL